MVSEESLTHSLSHNCIREHKLYILSLCEGDRSVAFGTLRISTQNGTKVYQKSINKSIRLNIHIGTLFFGNHKASLKLNSTLCAQFCFIL